MDDFEELNADLVDPWLLTLNEDDLAIYQHLRGAVDLERITFADRMYDSGALRLSQIEHGDDVEILTSFAQIYLVRPENPTVHFDWSSNHAMRDFKIRMAEKYEKRDTIGLRANSDPIWISATGERVADRPEHYAQALTFNFVDAARGKKVALVDVLAIVEKRLRRAEQARNTSLENGMKSRAEKQEGRIAEIQKQLKIINAAIELGINGSVSFRSGRGLYVSVKGHYNKITVPNIAMIPVADDYEIISPKLRNSKAKSLEVAISNNLTLRCENAEQAEALRNRVAEY